MTTQPENQPVEHGALQPPVSLSEIDEFLAFMFAASPLPSKDKSKPWHYAIAPGNSFESGGLTGKWCIFAAPARVDAAWDKVKSAVEEGRLLCAKVSTAYTKGFREEHVICVYTTSWEDVPDMLAVRAVLRELGFDEELGYKRDIETRNRVYGGSKEWYLRA